jgi:hypothetical protein
MNIYSILHNPKAGYEEDAWMAFAHRFSFSAAMFQVAWAFFYGLWLVMGLSLSFLLIVNYLQNNYILGSLACLLLRLLMAVYIGFCAEDWQVKKLMKSGYVLEDVVAAENKDKAFLKFYKKQYKACQLGMSKNGV